MTPQELLDYLDHQGISRKEFADRLGVSEAAISYWARDGGWIAFDRQAHIQLETKGKLRASWEDVPEDRRPIPQRAA